MYFSQNNCPVHMNPDVKNFLKSIKSRLWVIRAAAETLAGNG